MKQQTGLFVAASRNIDGTRRFSNAKTRLSSLLVGVVSKVFLSFLQKTKMGVTAY
jgi:hypothetical protein